MTPREHVMMAQSIFLDTAPIIYLVERHTRYFEAIRPVFNRFDAEEAMAVVTPVTLAECLVHPLRNQDDRLADAFNVILSSGHPTLMVDLDAIVGRLAASLRVQYGVTLTDALQLTAAIEAECDLFLTNDRRLQRVVEITVATVDDLVATRP